MDNFRVGLKMESVFEKSCPVCGFGIEWGWICETCNQ